MEPCKIKKNTLLYRFIFVYGDLNPYRRDLDTCTVRAHGLFAVFKILFIIAASCIILAPLIDALVALYAGLGFFDGIGGTYLAAELLVAIGLVAIGILIWSIHWALTKIHRKITAEEEVTPATILYCSLKERYCAPVEIVD